MSDTSKPRPRIALAYAETSRDLALQLARALEAAGFETDASGNPTSEAQLVLVCWTPAAVASDTVNREAAQARKMRRFAFVILAPCSAPAGFGRPMGDLSGWRGDAASREFLLLVGQLHGRLSGRMFSGDFWRSRYLSWGGLGAASLGAMAIIANLGDLTQTIDGAMNPAASQRDLDETKADVKEVLTLLKQRSGQSLSAEAEARLSDSIQRLLEDQDGARSRAGERLAMGDIEGALAELNITAQEGERAAASLAETYQEIGALSFLSNTFVAIDAYSRVTELNPRDSEALSMLGSLYMRTGNHEEAQRVFEKMLYQASTPLDHSDAHSKLGSLALIRGQLEAAEQYFRDALSFSEEGGDLISQGQNLNDLGEIFRLQGDFAKAESHVRRALKIAVDTGNSHGEAAAQLGLGSIAIDRNRLSDAAKAFTRSREIMASLGDPEGEAAAANSLAGVEFDRGRTDIAESLAQTALALAEQVSARESEAYALGLLAEIAEKRGDKPAAIEGYRDAMFIYRQLDMHDNASTFQDKLLDLGALAHPEGPEN